MAMNRAPSAPACVAFLVAITTICGDTSIPISLMSGRSASRLKPSSPVPQAMSTTVAPGGSAGRRPKMAVEIGARFARRMSGNTTARPGIEAQQVV